MGFFSGVGNFLSKAANFGGGLLKSFVGGCIGKIVDWFTNTTELKEAPKYDERNASMDETLKMNELLEKQRNSFQSNIKTLEEEIIKHTQLTFKEILITIEEINQKFILDINIPFIKKKTENFILSLNNILSDKVNSKIQISDSECSNLLKLEGEIREVSIDKYIKRIIREGIDFFLLEILDKNEEILELLKHEIEGKLKQKNTESNLLLEEIKNAQLGSSIEKKEVKKNDLLNKGKILKETLDYLNPVL